MTRRCAYRAPDVPRLADGSVDVRALCALLDEEANRGAGAPRTGVRSGNMGAENEGGPGDVCASPDPANPDCPEPTAMHATPAHSRRASEAAP